MSIAKYTPTQQDNIPKETPAIIIFIKLNFFYLPSVKHTPLAGPGN